MYFQQITTPGLGCFSYIIGCPKAGVMAVVDPRRDIEIYFEISKNMGMRISHIFETHIHADHVSGALELSHNTGATIYIHEKAPVEYEAQKVKHNDNFQLGEAGIKILHTPGHTPESISLIITDFTRSSSPEMLLTGDLLFVGDIGRPDLPGHQILDEQIQNLFNSLHEVLHDLPDFLEIYPAHGQGSLCGSGLSAKPSSTLGYERLANPKLKLKNFHDFKTNVMASLPMRPQSFSYIISTNRKGPALKFKNCDKGDGAISVDKAAAMQKQGALILDLRDALGFGAAHIPASLNVEYSSPAALNWIGMVIPPESSLILVLNNSADYFTIRKELSFIGLDNVQGFLDGGIQGWISQGRDLENLSNISAAAFKKSLEQKFPPMIIDVRSREEYRESKIEGSINLTFDELLAHGIPPAEKDVEKIIICRSGYRSAIAGSLMQANGCTNLSILTGGITALQKS